MYDIDKLYLIIYILSRFSGDEYNIVILSTVRSLPLSEIKVRKFVQPDRKWMRDNLGFLTDFHQLNVGITRAKHGLIIIGKSYDLLLCGYCTIIASFPLVFHAYMYVYITCQPSQKPAKKLVNYYFIPQVPFLE